MRLRHTSLDRILGEKARSLVLEQLEDRIVLDGAVADVQDVYEQTTDADSVDSLGWTYVDNGWWYNDDCSGWWWSQDSGWYWNENDGWWFKTETDFDFWYQGDHQYWANEHSTGAWFWWDDIDKQFWEPAFTWFADEVNGEWTWVYNNCTGSEYYTDSLHHLYQDHYGGAWWWFDAVNDGVWESYQTWFPDGLGVQVFNGEDSSEYVWGNNFHYIQQNTSSYVNDAPVLVVPGDQVVIEDTELAIPSMYVFDVDSGNNPVQITLAVAHGILTLPTTDGLNSVSGDGTQNAVFQGTWGQLNAALQNITYRPDANYNGSDTVTITVNDLGNTGSGGPLTYSDTVQISVNSVGDRPTATDFAVTTNEDATATLTGWGMSDPLDNPDDSPVSITLDVTSLQGTLSLGGTLLSTGTTVDWANVNSILFTPSSNWNGSTFFTYQITDNGSGTDAVTTSTGSTVSITVTPLVTNPGMVTDSDSVHGYEILAVYNNEFFFISFDQTHGTEIWRYNPATNTISILADINPGSNGSNPMQPALYNGSLYFSADDGVHGQELWRYDSASNAVSMVADIDPGSSGSRPGNLTIYNGALYFVNAGLPTGSHLWQYDATTNVVTDVWFGGPQIYDLTVYSGDLYFSADDGIHGSELYRYDSISSTVSIVADIVPGAGGSRPDSLTVWNGALYFVTDPLYDGNETIWRYDSTLNVASMVVEIDFASHHRGLIAHDSGLYFYGKVPAYGYELWRYNPVTNVASMAVDINPGPADSIYEFSPVIYNDSLYFAPWDGVHGSELWRYDFSANTASMVADINPGSASSSGLGTFVVYEGALYFPANDGIHGYQLWRYVA